MQIYLENLNKITIIIIFLPFFLFYFQNLLSWIQIQNGKWMQIHANSDPRPCFCLQNFATWPKYFLCPGDSESTQNPLFNFLNKGNHFSLFKKIKSLVRINSTNIKVVTGPVSQVGHPTTGRPGPLPTINAATFRQQPTGRPAAFAAATAAAARPHTTQPAPVAGSSGDHKFPHFPSAELTDVRSSYQGTYTERSPSYDYEEVSDLHCQVAILWLRGGRWRTLWYHLLTTMRR